MPAKTMIPSIMAVFLLECWALGKLDIIEQYVFILIQKNAPVGSPERPF
jgi:hypothetical protein